MSVSVTESGARRVERSALEQALREAEAATLAEFEVVRGSLRRAVEAATKCDAALAEEVVTHARMPSAMAQLAEEQVAEAGRAFGERDVDSARRLREHDRAINSANRRCFELAVHDGDEKTRREVAFLIATMARALERIGDNAVDIGGQVEFAVTGRLRPTS